MTEIEGVIEDLEKNINILNDVEEINLKDAQNLLTVIFEVLKDFLEKFLPVFKMVDKLTEIEKATEKGEKLGEKIDPNNQDLKSLYL